MFPKYIMHLRMIISCVTACDANDLESAGNCVFYNTVILLKSEISSLGTRSDTVTCTLAEKPNCAHFFIDWLRLKAGYEAWENCNAKITGLRKWNIVLKGRIHSLCWYCDKNHGVEAGICSSGCLFHNLCYDYYSSPLMLTMMRCLAHFSGNRRKPEKTICTNLSCWNTRAHLASLYIKWCVWLLVLVRHTRPFHVFTDW